MTSRNHDEKDSLPIDQQWVKSFRQKLFAWFKKNARQFPWRETSDPYKIWVSEIMLQQTTTATVIGYYERFLERFPNVQMLANAEDSDVLRYWEGLGYYRRAVQMHRSAKIIVSEHNAIFPDTYDAVFALPGIGRYTAGAILSLAYDQRLPILEANTIRLYARLLGYEGDPKKAEGNKLLWHFAEKILPPSKCRDFNLALMDLGSVLCTPKSPNCSNCPVVKLCKAASLGIQHAIPLLNNNKTFEERIEVALIIEKKGTYLLIRYPEGQRWAGLWDFPRSVVTSDYSLERDAVFKKNIKKMTGAEPEILERIASFRHAVTRFKIALYVHKAELADHNDFTEYETRWASIKEIRVLPFSTTGRKITKFLQ